MELHIDMSVKDFLDGHPETLPVFQSFGLHDFEKASVRDKLGPLLRVRTLLKHKQVDPVLFVSRCEAAAQIPGGTQSLPEVDIQKAKPTLLALMPCGLKVSLDRALQTFVEQYASSHEPLTYLAEGNVNHELSYYPYIDTVDSIDELPDLILSSDLNAFLHHRFIDRFVSPGGFVSINEGMSSKLEAAGLADPRGWFTTFCANPLVVVHVKDASPAVVPPTSWEDLLSADYNDAIIMRGQGDFFCSGVLVPFYRLFGLDALPRLARNVREGMHPSKMVKMIDSRAGQTPPLFIMPWFFAKKIKATHRIDILFPAEGAFVSPVQLLVKAGRKEALAPVTDFLMGEALHQHCRDNFFPSPHPAVGDALPEGSKLFWVGWDFIYDHDLGALKKEIGETFTAEYIKRRESP